MQNTIIIKITECYGDHAETITTHHTDDSSQAIDRALAKRYGKRGWLVEDRGLSEGYPRARFGQIVVPCDKRFGGLNCITGRLCIEIL